MSTISVVSPGIISDQDGLAKRLKQDFKAWLTFLRSGNDSAAFEAFAALKKDFQNSSFSTLDTSSVSSRRLSQSKK